MKALLITREDLTKLFSTTREDLRKEREKAMKGENLGWPFLPRIQVIPKKKVKK